MMRRYAPLLILIVIVLVVIGVLTYLRTRQNPVATPAVMVVLKPQAYVCPLRANTPIVPAGTCKDCLLYPVDKDHALSATYVPTLVETGLPGGGRVRLEVLDPLQQLFAAATDQGIEMVISSAYRSYAEQQIVFRSWFVGEWRSTGNFITAFVNAQRYSAWPGHSEHQLGTALDINCKGCVAFDTDNEKNKDVWRFLELNAHRFGFVISYPKDMEDRTGYQYEPWHIRYVGASLAASLYNAGYISGNGNCLTGLLRTLAHP